jgi:hypothetical protein
VRARIIRFRLRRGLFWLFVVDIRHERSNLGQNVTLTLYPKMGSTLALPHLLAGLKAC